MKIGVPVLVFANGTPLFCESVFCENSAVFIVMMISSYPPNFAP